MDALDNRRIKAALAFVLGLVSTLVLAAQSAPPSADTPVNPPLPPAKDVIARFVKEMGGKAAFDKIDSQHGQGKFTMTGQGLAGDLEVFAKRPDKLVIKINLPGVGELLEGFDGKVGWSVNPLTGPMVLDGKMLDQVREQAQFDSVLHNPAEFKSMETVARTNVEGKVCFQLKLVRSSGQEVTEFYDAKTGLLTASAETQETPLGPVNANGLTEDYKKFGDILLATKLTQKLGPLSQVMTFTSIEFNKVPDAAFALPESIQALLKK